MEIRFVVTATVGNDRLEIIVDPSRSLEPTREVNSNKEEGDFILKQSKIGDGSSVSVRYKDFGPCLDHYNQLFNILITQTAK